ncbi:MAG: hypothetical protein OXH39_09525 [Candidatus Poribacteria bacterium]|nr:hypothetical protein [Candidatus Poribacteria bacterium]
MKLLTQRATQNFTKRYLLFRANVISVSLIAYQLLENKPSVNLSELQGRNDLPVLF